MIYRQTSKARKKSFVFPAPLCLEVFVKGLLPALLCGLNVLVFGFKTSRLSFKSHGFFNECLLAILLRDPAAEKLGRALDNGSDLGELGQFCFAVFLFVVSLWVQHGAHSKKLEIPLEFGRQFRLREVEPISPSSRLFLEDCRQSADERRRHAKT